MKANDLLPIGDVARRTGLSVSAIRFYEDKGLVQSLRTGGNQRHYVRGEIRRLSFILIAQRLGLSLAEIEEVLSGLPQGRTPNAADWKRISSRIRKRIEDRIASLEKLRDNLDGCIGCGCLSLEKCTLYNAEDEAARSGPGPKVLQ